MVSMVHPDLPGREIEVQPQAVKIYENSGWTVGQIEKVVKAPDSAPDENKKEE